MMKLMPKIGKCLIGFALCLTSTFSLQVNNVKAKEETNLALNKTAVASSEEANSVRSALAVDGDTKSRSSRWGSAVQNAPHWIYIDLGENQSFNVVKVFWETRKATAYKIQIANTLTNAQTGEGDWQTVKTFTDRPENLEDEIMLDQMYQARYVRLYIDSATAKDPDSDGSWNSISIYEMEIYARENVKNPTSNLALNKTVTASNQYSTMPASKLTDGDDVSRWSSEQGVTQWAYVDLGQETEMNKFQMIWESDSVNAKNYNIYVSNSTTDWGHPVVAKTGSSGKKSEVILDEEARGRYVKLEVTSMNGYNSVSCCEFKIFNVDIDEQDPAENVALHKVAVASDREADSLGAEKVVDGNTTAKANRWASAVDGSSSDPNAIHQPHWIYVDLGKSMDVEVVKVFWWERKATNYEIQIADELTNEQTGEANWQTVKTFTQQPSKKEQKIVLDRVYQTRYVRLFIHDYDGQDPDSSIYWNNVSVSEIEIYGGNIIQRPTMDEVLDMITVETPQKGSSKLVVHLPTETAEENEYEVTYNGTDLEQVVDNELNIYQPISDKEVKVSFKIVDKTIETIRGDSPATSKRNYKFKEISVRIPGQYSTESSDNTAPKILPELAEWKGTTGRFTVGNQAKIVIANQQLKDIANAMVDDYKKMTGKTLKVVVGNQSHVNKGDFYFTLTTDKSKGLQDEGYLMEIENYVRVEAETTTGAYWATRTILQSLKQTNDIPQGVTRDYPLYKVRGFVLDVGRKTFKMDYLKQVVQQMAWYKMNDFQIHLNDNLIPLENLSPNEMDAYSAFRLESNIKKGGNDGKNKADLTSTDVYYTKEEFKDFIKESRVYGVNIVPEIDTPAHSLALTKVRPDLRLGTSGRQNDHLDLVNQYTECLRFVKEIFDEYMSGSDPVFDEDTIVHVGADEYSANQSRYVQFAKDMIKYVKETGRTARVWGSLSQSRRSQADVSQMTEVSENVQINLWNGSWANIDEMYELGFDLINCNDGHYYVVPAAGYYYDYLNDSTLYNLDINSISGFKVPAGDKQMVGGAFAVWNDMTDYLENGITEYDVYDRIDNAIPLFGAKLWGKGNQNLNQANETRRELGKAPNTNFEYKVESQENDIVNYPLDSFEDVSANGYDLTVGKNASIQSVDNKKALQLNGGESYVNTPLKTVGLGNDLRVKVKRTSNSTKEQILFESDYGTIKAVQKGTGKVGFSREGRDYSFDYELPLNEWVELEFKNVKDVTSLYVNGKKVDILGDDEVAAENKKLHATTMYPFERIGSQTHAFIGYVDDLRLGKDETMNSTMELDYVVEKAEFILNERHDKKLQEVVNEAKELFRKYNPTQAEIENLLDKLNTILNESKYAKADYTRVDKYLDLISDDLSMFTEQSVNRLERIVDSIRRDLPVTMQDVVDNYATQLEKALDELELKTKSNVNYIANDRLTANASSWQGNGAHPNKAIDDDPDTMWHTDWSITTFPHWISFTIDTPAKISGISYTPRSGAGNGTLLSYDVEVSDDGQNWRVIKSGDLERNDKTKEILFDTVTTQHIRLKFKSAVGVNGSAAEIKLHDGGVAADVLGLQELVKKAEKIENVGYTDETWIELKDEIEKANTLIHSDNPDPEVVEVEKRLLNEKMIKLHLNDNIKGVNKVDLYNQIQITNKVSNDILDMIIQSVADQFRISLDDATKELYNENATQEAVDLLYKQLKEVYELLLESKVDKSQLKETVHTATQFNQKDFTTESWNTLEKALKEANEMLDNKEASQNDVNQVEKALQDAIKALVKKTDDNKPTEPDKPTDPSKPADDENKPNKPSVDSDVLGDKVNTTNKEEPPVESNQTPNNKTTNNKNVISAKTGDDVMIAPYAVLAICAVGAYMIIRKKKHS